MEENKNTGSKTKSRIKTIAYWFFTGILALEAAAGAQWDLSRNQYVKDLFIHLGYPYFLLTILGFWKILAFIVILIPKFPLVKEWAYAGIFFVFTGAAASHLAVGDSFGAWFGPFVFALFTVASWCLRPPSRRLA